jgi:hypothetical protein
MVAGEKIYFQRKGSRRLHAYMEIVEKIYFQKNCNGSLHAYIAVGEK